MKIHRRFPVNQHLSDAKVNPHYLGNDLVGVRIRNVSPGRFWHRVGVRDDDLIVEINGTRIDNAEATNQLMNSLADVLADELHRTITEQKETTAGMSATKSANVKLVVVGPWSLEDPTREV